MSAKQQSARRQLWEILGLSSTVSLAFLVGRMIATQGVTFWFLASNLLLAWLPLVFAWALVSGLRRKRWLSPLNILLSVLWLVFLPNAFYMASDIIHLTAYQPVSLLYDVSMFLSFTINGFLVGYLSLFAIQHQLKRRYGGVVAAWLAAGVLLLCSFAIYLGRYLHWNSWDIVTNPVGLIFDVSDPFFSPTSHPQVFTTTLMFFVLLGSIYATGYKLVQLLQQNRD